MGTPILWIWKPPHVPNHQAVPSISSIFAQEDVEAHHPATLDIIQAICEEFGRSHANCHDVKLRKLAGLDKDRGFLDGEFSIVDVCNICIYIYIVCMCMYVYLKNIYNISIYIYS